MVAWARATSLTCANSWDIYARSFSSPSAGAAAQSRRVNTTLYGDQYAPRDQCHWRRLSGRCGRAWARMVRARACYGQFVHAAARLVGGEFRVNTTTVGSQMQPAVASDGASQFVVVWTSSHGYRRPSECFDLFAQRYINANLAFQLAADERAVCLGAVHVEQRRLSAAIAGFLGRCCRESPFPTTRFMWMAPIRRRALVSAASNQWTMTARNGLTTNSTHWFQVAYLTTLPGVSRRCRRPRSGTTWSGLNWGGIPYEWMAYYFGGYVNGVYHTNYWPAATSPAASGGPTLLQVFLSGGDPFDSSTWR